MRSLPASLALLAALGLTVSPAPGAASEEAAPAAPTDPDERDAALRPVAVGETGFVLGGYIQPTFEYNADTAFNEDDYDGFAFRNARLTATGAWGLRSELDTSARLELDFAEGAVSVLDLYGTLSWRDGLLSIDAGQFKTPFSLLELTSEATAQFPLARAGEVSTRRLLIGRDRGVQLRSELRPADQLIELRVAMVNGQGLNALKNFDSEFQYAGRIAWHPLGEVSPGEADLDDSPPGFAIGGSLAHTPKNGNSAFGLESVGVPQTRFGGDVRMKFRGVSVRGEYLHAVTAQDAGDVSGFAAYAQAGYVLPLPVWPRLEVVGRWSQIDLHTDLDGFTTVSTNPVTGAREPYRVFTDYDRTLHQRWEFGVNAYLADHRAKVGVVYRLTDLLEGAKTDVDGNPLFGDAVFVMLQVGWL